MHRSQILGWVGLALSLALLAKGAVADELLGRVVAVSDGDTITVLDADKRQHRVRLAGIDAPEKGQAFGQAARDHLSDLAFGRSVSVDWHKVDRYGRLVGKVLVDKRDANLEQVRAGYAWHYGQYAHEQSEDDRRRYAESAAEAREKRIGLWREPSPTPPWEWRAQKRAGR